MIVNSGPRVSNAVKWLLISSVGVYILQMIPVLGNYLTEYGALVPSWVYLRGQVWRLATYMFLHGSALHLLFNMLILWMMGTELEEIWGTKRFLIFYFIVGMGSGMLSIVTPNIPIIGASGALYGIMLVYGMHFPDRKLLLFFVIPIPARLAAVVFFFLSLILMPQGVAHFTHLGGIVVGYVYMKIYPFVEKWYTNRVEVFEENDRRRRAEEYLSREKHFDQVIDPILKKISEHGMESLTRKEKALLKKTAKTDRDRLKRSKILPFDIFNK